MKMTALLLALALLGGTASAQSLDSAANLLSGAARNFSRALAERPRAAVQVAAAAVDACRTGSALDRMSMTLRVTPPGGTPFDELLAYDGCYTRTDDLILGDATPPWAARYFQLKGTPWAFILETFDGASTTTLYVYYKAPATKTPELIAVRKARRTADIAAGFVDWGEGKIDDLGVLPFNFARFGTY